MPERARFKKKRAQFVAQLRANADKTNPSQGSNPSNFGWEKNGEMWVPTWYIGPPLPEKLAEASVEGQEAEEERGEEAEEDSDEEEDGVWSEHSEDEDDDEEYR